MLDVHGTLAVENDQKVLYASCLISPQPVSLVLTLPWQCNHKGHPIILRTRLVIAPTDIFSRIDNIATSSYKRGGSFFFVDPGKITA